MIIYAVGDIHGCSEKLNNLLPQIEADAAQRSGPKQIVYLGDYVDRGPDSAGVIERLMQGPPLGIDEQVCLRGNHEDMMLSAFRGIDWLRHWHTQGGKATKASYRMKSHLRDRHLAWIEGLPLTHQVDGFLFVHAGIVPGRPLARQKPHNLLWIRDEFLKSDVDHGFVVVHGHSPDDPHRHNKANRINVDTGAVFGGPLSCVVLDTGRPKFRAVIQAR